MAVPVGFAGAVAQLGERRFCKPEVVGSIPISSTAEENEELEQLVRQSLLAAVEDFEKRVGF